MRISVCIPFHWMKNWEFFLNRCLKSIEAQTFTDYEVILIKSGKMAETSNHTITSAKGQIIKLLYMDDYLAHPDSLKVIHDNFDEDTVWLATGCAHDLNGEVGNTHLPEWSPKISQGINTIGSPSVVAMRNLSPYFNRYEGRELFDEELSWVLDCDLYTRMGKRYGPPKLIEDINVVIGLHEGQMTNILTDEEKLKENNYLLEKNERGILP